MISSLQRWLAILADCYNPTLLMLCLFMCVYQARKDLPWYGVRLVLIAVASYTMMFIDKFMQIWSSVGLDFSTHAATSLGMVLFLSAQWSHAARWAIGGSFLAYCLLMNILHYHSWADIISTSLVMAFLFWLVFKVTSGLILKSTTRV